MQHKKLFLDRPKRKVTSPAHISTVYPEVIRKLAEHHGITEEEAIRRLEGKVTPPTE